MAWLKLRLLPMLSTHRSFPEIAQEMVLSRYTIKSQVNAIYRKLGRLLTQPGSHPVAGPRPVVALRVSVWCCR